MSYNFKMNNKMQPSFESLTQFQSLKFGWINPNNELIACRVMEHIKALPEVYQSRYEMLVDEYNTQMYEQLQQEQEDAGDEYYHPAMHRFNPEYDAHYEVLQELYTEGYVRLGYFGKTLEVCGDNNRIKLLSDYFDFIVDVIGLEKWTRRK